METTWKTRAEKRAEPRQLVDQYQRVEIDFKNDLPLFQFQLRDISPSGLGVLVKADSEVLAHLKVGQVVNMQYNPKSPDHSTQQMQTEIRHITYLAEGRYSGHYLVGFALIRGD